ncbi:MAG: glycosyltransferase family 4 protein, partial [Pirellulales bacterium]|nr:glycosyltransferase family 4 protein [Pirellulales bacterium]
FLQEAGVECRTMRWANSTTRHVRWILQEVARIDPDVFVANMSVPACFAARWIRDAGVPTVAACRADNAFYRTLIDQFVNGPLQWRVSGLLCVSEELKQRVVQQGATSLPIAVIPSGVPIAPQANAGFDPFRLAYVGRLQQEQKRIGLVMEALLETLERLPQATGLVVGSGPEAKAIERLAQDRGLADRINFRGGVPCEQMADVLKDSSVIFLLSDYEGTPGALMDAMAAGVVPVCRTIPGGVRELVQHRSNGWVVGDTASDAVAGALELAQDHALWKRLSQQARQTIDQRYSLEKSVLAWEEFCRQLCRDTTKQSFTLPQRLDLPAVQRAFAREDVRWWNVYRRVKGWAGRWLIRYDVDRSAV